MSLQPPWIRFCRAFAIPIAVLVGAVLGCDDGATGPNQSSPSILGSCDVAPNYVAQVGLNRWREFPLRYDISESTFPEENRDDVLAQVIDGINLWGVLTNGRIGSLVRTDNRTDVDLIIVAEDIGSASARTTHETGDPFLSDGRIAFDRQTVIQLSGIDGARYLSALAAHEMGHLLGIIGHPTMEGVLMHIPLQAPRPTTADLNTISHAYCR